MCRHFRILAAVFTPFLVLCPKLRQETSISSNFYTLRNFWPVIWHHGPASASCNCIFDTFMLSSVVCYSFKYHLKVYEHWKRTEYQRRIWKFEAVGINDFIYDGHCRIIDRISNLTCISHRGWFQFRDFWISYLMTGVYIKSNQLMVILCHLTYSEVVILCYNSQELFLELVSIILKFVNFI